MDSVTAQIKQLIETGAADPDPGQSREAGEDSRPEQADEHGEQQASGHGELDIPQSDPAASVEDDTQGEQGEDTGDIGQEDDGDAGGVAEEQHVELSDIAEAMELPASKLYDVRVPMGKGMDPVSLGDLKDYYKGGKPLDEREGSLRERTHAQELQMLRARSDLNRIMALMPDSMRAQLINAAQSEGSAYRERQQQMAVEVRPQWKDPDVKAQDMGRAVEAGRRLGYSEAEVRATEDIRGIMLLIENQDLRDKLDAINTAGKRAKRKANLPGRRKTQSKRASIESAEQRARQTGDVADKRNAVRTILMGQ